MKTAQEKLNLLSIFWWISAGLTTLVGCCSVGYVGVIFAAIGNDISHKSGDPAAPAVLTGIGIVAAVLILFFVLLGVVLNYLTGKFLREHRHWTFCFVLSILACLNFPGIILGIFTIIVLNEPETRRLFGRV